MAALAGMVAQVLEEGSGASVATAALGKPAVPGGTAGLVVRVERSTSFWVRANVCWVICMSPAATAAMVAMSEQAALEATAVPAAMAEQGPQAVPELMAEVPLPTMRLGGWAEAEATVDPVVMADPAEMREAVETEVLPEMGAKVAMEARLQSPTVEV